MAAGVVIRRDAASDGPLRILLATYWPLPHVGGVSAFVDLLAQELRARGHLVDILGHTPDMQQIYMANTGRSVEKKPIKDYVYETMIHFFESQLPLVDPWIRWREIERYTFELCCLPFGVQNYDVVHTQDIVSTRAIARIRASTGGHVATIHGLLATEYLASGDITDRQSLPFAYARAEEYYGCTSADITMVPAVWLREQMERECGVPPSCIRVVPYGMDLETFLLRSRRWPERLPKATNRRILLCPARLVSVKGHRVLLDAVEELRKDFRLAVWLAGDGPLRQELETQTAERGLGEEVRFLGARDDVPALMGLADVVVLPSVQDTLPFAVMESQVIGTPIVASRVGGIPEMIQDGVTGVLVEPGSSKDLAQKLRHLLLDEKRLARMAEAERTFGREAWAPKALVDRMLSAYRESAGKGGSE